MPTYGFAQTERYLVEVTTEYTIEADHYEDAIAMIKEQGDIDLIESANKIRSAETHRSYISPENNSGVSTLIVRKIRTTSAAPTEVVYENGDTDSWGLMYNE